MANGKTHREWLVDNLMGHHGLSQAEAAQVVVRIAANARADSVRANLDKRPDEMLADEMPVPGKRALTLALQEELPIWLAEQNADHPLRLKLKKQSGT